MTALSPDQALEALACREVYTVGDTARHFGVSKSTIARLWRFDRDTADLPEPPNIWHTRTTDDLILADGQLLLNRGLTLDQAAAHLGVSTMTFTRAYLRAGRRYRIRHDHAWRHIA